MFMVQCVFMYMNTLFQNLHRLVLYYSKSHGPHTCTCVHIIEHVVWRCVYYVGYYCEFVLMGA